ncbi:hypothetical protein F4677DRAFT_428958 [Hypoxylon crocopeplum]|nr:hypothetical protein F4677DRAFT_428958 [Hypoxylon crocopeplum]
MPASRSSDNKDRQRWTADQDSILVSAVARVSTESSDINWHHVASYLPGRTNKDCRKRWHYKLAHNFRKGPWSAEEDQRLRDAVQKHDTKWNKVSAEVGTRNGDQCWKRWNDSLDPSIDHSPWNANEDTVLLQAVETMGRNWSDIVNRYLAGRTALAAKNRFSLLHRRIESTQTATKAGENVGTSPSSSSSTSISSNAVEDNDFDFMDLNGDVLPISRDNGQEPTGYLNNPSFGTDVILGLTTPQTLPYPTPNSIQTPTKDAHSQYPDIFDYTFRNDMDSFRPITELGVIASSIDKHVPTDSSTRELVVRAKCRSDRAEKVMESLTRLVNNMMMQGDVNDVNFSIVEA